MKKVKTAILLLILIFFVIGCVEDETPTKGTTYQPSTTSSPTATATPTELNLKIGETAKTSELEVTIISAEMKRYYTYYSDFFNDPMTETSSPENIYIIVEADIKNIGPDSTFVSSGDFSVTDSEGYRYDPVLYAGKDGLEMFKELYSNQKTKGRIIFEVPKSANDLKIQYDFGNLFSGTKLASWKVE